MRVTKGSQSRSDPASSSASHYRSHIAAEPAAEDLRIMREGRIQVRNHRRIGPFLRPIHDRGPTGTGQRVGNIARRSHLRLRKAYVKAGHVDPCEPQQFLPSRRKDFARLILKDHPERRGHSRSPIVRCAPSDPDEQLPRPPIEGSPHHFPHTVRCRYPRVAASRGNQQESRGFGHLDDRELAMIGNSPSCGHAAAGEGTLHVRCHDRCTEGKSERAEKSFSAVRDGMEGNGCLRNHGENPSPHCLGRIRSREGSLE